MDARETRLWRNPGYRPCTLDPRAAIPILRVARREYRAATPLDDIPARPRKKTVSRKG